MMPRARDVASDPVIALRMEPLRLALQGTADRMQHGMMRAAVSSIARESGDCAAALFMADGRLLAQARSLPLLLGSLIPAVAGVLIRFPLATMSEGDAYLLNDPWSGGTHLPDLALVHPVFHDGEVIAFAAANLHHQDVGGMAAGSIPPDATEVYQEGLRLPPVRWRSAEGVLPDIDAILAANSRTPDNLRGDLEAQWTALTQGARELKQIARHTGPRFAEVCDALIAQTECMTRAALAAAPDGEWTWRDQLDGDGIDSNPVSIVVSLRKQDDTLVIDFEGTAPQVRGPLNASPAAMLSAALFFMRTLAPDAPNNAGCLAPLTLKLPPGSLVNPVLPAAVNARTATVKLACNAILGAWSQSESGVGVAPHAGVATVLALSGTRADGRRWMFTEIIASGAGASVHAPGRAGVSTDVGNARNTPVEVIETEAPLRVECYEIRRGSGGAGLQCGGDGVRRAYRLLDGQGWIAYRGERHVGRARGARGGEAGATSMARVLRVDGAIELLPARARIAWSAGDLLIIETAGGGGWGALAPIESANPTRKELSMIRFPMSRCATLALASIAMLMPALAHAQSTYPNKPIHIVVPFAPGGSTDVLARRVGEKIAAAWGQPVVVDNRPGAGGALGADFVAKSAPDGYNLLAGVTGSNAIAQALYPKLPYNVINDFAPVSMMVNSPLVLAVNPDVKANTPAEFLALAKSKPGELSYGSAGNGTSMHLTGEMYKQATDVSMVHVPYRGSAAMLTDLMGGQIQVTFGDVLVLMPQIQAGKIRALAVTSKTRHPLLPDVPTLDESGLKGFEALSWQGLFAPAGTPPEVVEKLSAEVNKAMQSPDIRDYFAAQGFIVQGSTPEAFKAFVASEVQKWTPIVKNSGAQVN